MRAFGLGLAFFGFAIGALAIGPASAACRCVCFNGVVRTQCSGPLDPPAICNLICPMPARPQGSPPQISGIVPPVSGEATLGTGSPALLGSTGLGR